MTRQPNKLGKPSGLNRRWRPRLEALEGRFVPGETLLGAALTGASFALPGPEGRAVDRIDAGVRGGASIPAADSTGAQGGAFSTAVSPASQAAPGYATAPATGDSSGISPEAGDGLPDRGAPARGSHSQPPPQPQPTLVTSAWAGGAVSAPARDGAGGAAGFTAGRAGQSAGNLPSAQQASLVLNNVPGTGFGQSRPATAPAPGSSGSGGTIQDTCSPSLVPDIAAPQLVGERVHWTATAANCGKTPTFQFSVGPTGGPLQVVRDFYVDNTFTWAPMGDGSYDVRVAVKDGYDNTPTTSAVVTDVVESRVTGAAPVVTPLGNPLATLYSAPPSLGGTLRVDFRPANAAEDAPWASTATEAVAPGHSANVIVAGLEPHTTYKLVGVTDQGPVAPVFFTTGAPPAQYIFPDFSVVQPPDVGSDLSQNTIFHALVAFGGPPTQVNVLATDLTGNVVWYYDPLSSGLDGIFATTLVPGGTVLLQGTSSQYSDSILREVDLAGNTVRETNRQIVNAELAARGILPIENFHHDAVRLPDGNTAVLTQSVRTVIAHGQQTDLLGDVVVVLDKDFQVVWAWDAVNYLDVNRGPTGGEDPTDWLHSNAVAYSPADGNLIVSMRHQDWVIKIDYENGTGDGHVIWRLGPDGDFTINSDDPSPWFTHQHNAHYLNDTTLILFDNGNTRCAGDPNCDSRGQVLSLDEQKMVATPILNADLGGYSAALGAAQQLPNGNYSFTSGFLGFPLIPYAQAIEVRPDGTPAYVLQDNSGYEYRSYRVGDLYQGVDAGRGPGGTAPAKHPAAPAGPGSTPQVVDQTPTDTFGPVGDVRVTFNEPIDPTTFTLDQAGFYNSRGVAIPVSAVTPVDGGDDTQFDIAFPEQTALGAYSLVVGPDIADLAGVPMGDPYYGIVTIQGPKVLASSPGDRATLSGGVDSVRVSFNEPMDASTFTPQQVDYFSGPAGRIAATGVTPVEGSDTDFDITFAPQSLTGDYTLGIGPDIQDLFGHRMDQNGNSIEGEFPGDVFAVNFSILGPRVVSQSVGSTLGVYSARVTFNVPMDPQTFTAAQVDSFDGPDGPVPVAGVVPVPGTDYTQFDIVFAPLTRAGSYAMVLDQGISDRLGNPLQGDYSLDFTLSSPRVVTSSPTGSIITPVDHVRLTFNYPIDPTTFTPDEVAPFIGPNGDIPVTDVQVVPFTNDTQFDVTFDTQGDFGDYSMTIGPDIQDVYGNFVVPYLAQFSIVDAGSPGGAPARPTVAPAEAVPALRNRPSPLTTAEVMAVTLGSGALNPVTPATPGGPISNGRSVGTVPPTQGNPPINGAAPIGAPEPTRPRVPAKTDGVRRTPGWGRLERHDVDVLIEGPV